ncbi:Signal transduction histidine kinase regulating citrate/malate metabolism [Operophtera brumata]|uniref:Signal transduction histidine kinase regulating citrate/malate metabolism n=1 Tax=Operophtera brumata TaxID=104452 RepID=A0A0L7L018_OPEBR|nr:Signal transduction histidine kinase regulating citrate/malate metabolism [Operophtera brumata]
MSSKSLELVLNELQKTVKTLVNKVTGLESQINKQSDVIAKQSEIISDFATHTNLSTTRKSFCSTPETNLITKIELPKRQAAINASAALSTGASKKRTVGKRQTAKPGPDEINCAKVNDAMTTGVSCTVMSKNKLPSVSATKGAAILPARNMMPIIGPTIDNSNIKCGPESEINIVSTQPDDDKNDNNTDWRFVSTRNQRKQRKIIEGAGADNSDLKTVEKLQFIQAWSFRPETTAENISKHLNKIHTSNDYTVQKREIKTTRHAAFVIGIPGSLFEKISQPSVWPSGVRLGEWFLVRPRAQRGYTPTSEAC